MGGNHKFDVPSFVAGRFDPFFESCIDFSERGPASIRVSGSPQQLMRTDREGGRDRIVDAPFTGLTMAS